MPSTPTIHHSTERGIAMITTLLVLMLMSALLVGFTTVVMSDQRYRWIDKDRGQAFYAASAGVEKLTADLGNMFLENVAPTTLQVTSLTAAAKVPVICDPGGGCISFVAPQAPQALPASQLTNYHCARTPGPPVVTKTPTIVGTNGYTVTFCKSNTTNNPTISDDTTVISGTGAYAGMTALQTPYQIDVTAKTPTGGEVHLVRTVQAVAIPVFQFGIFSESDLSFFAEQNFTFGGRIHTNGNLWMGQFAGTTLTTTGKVTAVGDVVRQYFSNGVSGAALGLTGTVSMATSLVSPAGNRNMAVTEGSVAGLPGSTATANWNLLSLGATPTYYNGFVKNTATGAKKLNLPLVAPAVGGSNADLIRRPPAAEPTTGLLFNERLYSKASLRILLSDTAADITTLPGISAGAPVSLDAWASPVGYTATANLTHPPVASSFGPAITNITGSAGGPAYTITVGSTLAFRPVLVLNSALTGQTAITCTTKTATTFTGCAPGIPVTLVAGTTFVTGGTGVSTVTTAPTTLNAATVTVASTAAFNPAPFWAAVGGVDTLITCTGYTATTFTGCNANPANGASAVSGYMSNAGISTLGGFIKIDRQNADSTWTDVTTEILNYGIGGQNLGGTICAEPTANAVVRLQRLRDNGGVNGGGCNYGTDTSGAKDATNWWPNVLFDTRESALRDDPALTTMTLGGVMYYVSLDVANLVKYFQGTTAPFNAPGGAGTKTDNGGYTVYFSDRRNNRNLANLETGEYGWEDFVNPGNVTGAPNGTLQVGEDVNGSNLLETYGGTPNYLAARTQVPPCSIGGNLCGTGAVYGNAPTTGYVLAAATAGPTTTLNQHAAQVNRPILFRRALKLIRGAVIAPTLTGLTIVSENPVYLHADTNGGACVGGCWNTDSGFAANNVHAATAIIADAVTILSGAWNDNNSFIRPFAFVIGQVGRDRAPQSYYRVAILGGKGINFPKPGDVVGNTVFGTDGGAHNFLRMLEQDGTAAGTDTVNYRGSMATLYYNRQAVGTFKCCSNSASGNDGIVYSVPVRNFFFDTDFLTPALLPPNTPMFRDMNTVGFSQELRPGK
jgi:Tfp pilus assembly protein PilX